MEGNFTDCGCNVNLQMNLSMRKTCVSLNYICSGLSTSATYGVWFSLVFSPALDKSLIEKYNLEIEKYIRSKTQKF